MPTPFLADAQAMYDDLVAIRRDLHMHPEMGFQEFRTAGIVAERLNALGYEVTTGVGQTGVVALMGGAQPGERTVLLRFDMDALPIDEQNDVPYRSQTPGVMHACGHDAHVSIGIGVATLLAQHRARWGGTVKLMFQPAEEALGGARAMIADGLLHNPAPDVALGLHVWTEQEVGTAVVREGALMAAGDEVTIEVIGTGGHGARPHETVDAIVVASHIVVALQTIVARNLDPEEVGVISVGVFHAGSACNIIAERATLRLSVRSFTPAARELQHRRIREVADGVAATFGARALVTRRDGVDATVCAPAPTAVVHQVAAEILGAANVDTSYRSTAGEDFSVVLDAVPGNYFFLGARNSAKGIGAPHHNPRFDIDEACMPQGVAILCEAAVRCLAEDPRSSSTS